jgi:SPP1 gp7 family putative phage head morphogenesis protein
MRRYLLGTTRFGWRAVDYKAADGPERAGPFEDERLAAEAEFAAAVEKALAKTFARIKKRLNQQFGQKSLLLVGEKAVRPGAFDDAAFWALGKDEMLSAAGPQVNSLLMQGTRQAQALGLSVNFNVVNKNVLAFSKTYQDQWWKALQRTNQRALRTAITRNIKEGGSLRSLTKSLAPTFGKARAQTIASTEVTRLYAEGNRMGYADAGVEHTEWRTVADDLVDEVCFSLHGKRWRQGKEKSVPPIHVSCRCWLAPVVADKAITKEPTLREQTVKMRASAFKARPGVTRTLKQMGKARDGKLVGEEFAVKGRNSLLRKMNEKVAQGMPQEAVPGQINDVLRYTLQFDEAGYAKGVQGTLSGLRASGYKVRQVTNYWDVKGGYQGGNTIILSPTGQRFELQFHTAISRDLKEKAHLLYQKTRTMKPGPARATLEAEMETIFASVPVPTGAPGMTYGRLGLEKAGEGVWVAV